MMEAYFDESGTHAKSPVVCVAGYLFKQEQASHLNREWSEALRRFGVSAYHANECSNGQGEFRLLSSEQRTELTKRLVGIVKRRMEIGIAVSISETDFEQTEPLHWMKGGPYMICAMYLL